MEVRRLIAATAVGAVGVVVGPVAISGGAVAHAAAGPPVTCHADQQVNGMYEIQLITPGHEVMYTAPEYPQGLNCEVTRPPV